VLAVANPPHSGRSQGKIYTKAPLLSEQGLGVRVE